MPECANDPSAPNQQRQKSAWIRLGLYLGTIRHIPPGQLFHRVRRIGRRHWRQFLGKSAPAVPRWTLGPWLPLYAGLDEVGSKAAAGGEAASAIERAERLAQRRFCFLNREVRFQDEIQWQASELSRLWRYHLHYFDYLQDLFVWSAAGQQEQAFLTFRALAESWIGSNRLLQGDGWHPFTISLRLVNWLNAAQIFSLELQADTHFRDRILGSLAAQLGALSGDLEWDVRGNHLLKNLRALIWAAVCFRGSEPRALLPQSLRLLEAEVREQILCDGGHFERVPGYHLTVFKDLLEIGLLLRRNQDQAPAWLDEAVARMAAFTLQILGPDDRVPMLKDTAWDACPDPAGLLTAAAIYLCDPSLKRTEKPGIYPKLLFCREERKRFDDWPVSRKARPSLHLAASGYFVLRGEPQGDCLIFDAGQPCPDYLPAHAHADLLSYELQVEGRPVVVDSGVYEYAPGHWREFFRSTRAHNTVSIGGRDQSEVWDSFRVAARAKPAKVSWQESESYALLQAEHDGYRRLKPPAVHRRTLLWLKQAGLWVIVDQVSEPCPHSLESHLHFHPDCSLQPADVNSWRVEAKGGTVWLSAFGMRSFETVHGQKAPFLQGWHSERFGCLAPNTCLTFCADGTLPICFGYALGKSPAAVEAPTALPGGGARIQAAEGLFRLTLPVNSPPTLQ